MAARRGRHGAVLLGRYWVTGLTDFSVSNPHSMVDTTVMSNYYATQLKDVMGPWTASFSAKENVTNFGNLFNYSQGMDVMILYFYPGGTASPNDYLYGDGVFSIDSSVTMGDTVNFSGTVDGSGQLQWGG